MYSFCENIKLDYVIFEHRVCRAMLNQKISSIEQLLLDKGKTIPPVDDETDDRKTALALACIAAIKPAYTDVQAARCLAKSFVLENPDIYADDLVDPDLLAGLRVAI